jgi:hypothetical protein
MVRRLLVVNTAEALPDWICRGKRLGDGPRLLLTPEVVIQPGERFRPGDRIVLRRPFEPTIEARIAGFIGMGGYGYGPPGVWVNYLDCLVVRNLCPEAVPPGTEVWSVDRP